MFFPVINILKVILLWINNFFEREFNLWIAYHDINRVGNIADFGNRVRVLGSGPHISTQFFWEYPAGILIE